GREVDVEDEGQGRAADREGRRLRRRCREEIAAQGWWSCGSDSPGSTRFATSSNCSGDIPCSFFRNATSPQIDSSSCVMPHAGIAVSLMPCLIAQNCSRGSAGQGSASFGGCG